MIGDLRLLSRFRSLGVVSSHVVGGTETGPVKRRSLSDIGIKDRLITYALPSKYMN